MARKLICSDMHPGHFGQLVTAMPELINPVPRDTPSLVEMLSGSGASLLLNEMRNAAMADGLATYGMMASEGRGWQGSSGRQHGKVIREGRMKEVLGVVILALRAGDDSTANATGRKAEQWNNLECDYGGALNANLHVGGDGHAPTNAKSEKVTLIAFIKGTPTYMGKAGIMTDGYRKALKKLKAVGSGPGLRTTLSHSYRGIFCRVWPSCWY